MRPIADVIDAINNQIPEDFDQREELLEKMERTKEGASDTDSVLLHWQALSHHLNEHVGEPGDDEWKKTIEGIIVGELDYKDYL